MPSFDDLKKLIDNDRSCKKGKYTGRVLYYYKPQVKIEDEVILVGNNIVHKRKNNGIYVNYFKQLVTQKIDYLLAGAVTVDESLINLQIDVNDLLDNVMLNASLDSITWTYLYIDPITNKIQWAIVPDAEIIPFYDSYGKILEQLIRYYPISDKETRIEIWTKNDVTFFTIDDKNIISTEARCHYQVESVYNGEVEDIQYKSFGFIPFIPCYNNKDKTSDSADIECLITVYNDICTGFIDNIKKFQEAILKLTNYTGTQESLREFLDNVNKNGIVGMPEGGDLEQMAVDIPVEARTTLLTILKEAIYNIGRGMNPDQLGDGNITNVVIKARYQQLSFKSSDCEKRIRVFYTQLINVLNMFYSTSVSNELTFNSSMLVNESEVIKDCVASVGIISRETIVKNHPWTDDLTLEMARLEKEDAEEV